MARIRSVHPGFFTDERLVTASRDARLFFIGLCVEADDKGVFEWKPLTLKMKIFPADNVDVDEFLSELVAAEAICAYEIDGRKYGAIRNFRKHQKPKTPNDVHPITNDIGKYVALPDAISETFPQKVEKPLLMEDGGGKMEGEGEKKDRGAGAPPMAFVGKVIRLTAEDYERWKTTFHAVPDMHAELTAADAHYADKPPKDGKWFFPVSNWLKRAHEQALAKHAEEASARRSWN